MLPYSEPYRGGFQTQQYVIKLDMLGRNQKQVVLLSNMFSQKKNRASWYLLKNWLRQFKLWKKNKMLVSLVFCRVPLAKEGKGSMHYQKEVTSQVLRGQRNERGTSAQVPA